LGHWEQWDNGNNFDILVFYKIVLLRSESRDMVIVLEIDKNVKMFPKHNDVHFSL